MSVLGIDFGNDNCVIAVARRGGIDMAVNSCSNRATPTVVGFGNNGEGRCLGEKGKTSIMSNIKGTVLNLKRYIGRSLAEPSLQDERAMQTCGVVDGEREASFEVNFEGEKQSFEATRVAGMMFQVPPTPIPALSHRAGAGPLGWLRPRGRGTLIEVSRSPAPATRHSHPAVLRLSAAWRVVWQDLKSIAELECKMPVADCVIGVPSYWSDRQRRAIHDAATMAGFKVSPARTVGVGEE